MFKKILFAGALMLSGMALTQPVNAQAKFFDPDASCTAALSEKSNRAALWTFGFLSHLEGEARAVTSGTIADLVAQMSAACEKIPETVFLTLVRNMFDADVMLQSAPTSSDPQALVEFFSSNGVELNYLLALLKPTPQDVRAVYPEPMVSKLLDMYDDMFDVRLAREDFPAYHIVMSSAFTTSMELAHDPLLEEISGGFKDVLDKFLLDVPFGTVNIGFPTVDDNMKLHGLMYVNGHWVLMSHPWRGLDD